MPATGIERRLATERLPHFAEATLIEVKPPAEKRRLIVVSSIGGFET
jgi:hypothetical protein